MGQWVEKQKDGKGNSGSNGMFYMAAFSYVHITINIHRILYFRRCLLYMNYTYFNKLKL